MFPALPSAGLIAQNFSSLHTSTSIHIEAPRERVFDFVRDLEQWPALLPHYRFVKVLGEEDGRQIVHMGASRDGIPISWVSAYMADPDRLELRFTHLRAFTKGMEVIWKLTPTQTGTQVDILHDLRFRVPILAWLAEPIIGGFFIGNIAAKTLRTFKALLESPAP